MNQLLSLDSFDILHATTLFSDGALALKVYKKYKIPYIVTIRETDISVFLKYRPDLVILANEILKHAKKIIFISPTLKIKFFQNWFLKSKEEIYEHKFALIYNGIDTFWLNNLAKPNIVVPTKILFVGRLIKRKNIFNLAKTILLLNQNGIKCELNIVGEGIKEENKIKKFLVDEDNKINFLGTVKDLNKLKKIYRTNHIFAMVSYAETFGLSYIEALSQGLPILYNIGEGVDLVFDDNVGEKCDGNDIDDVYKALKKMILNFRDYDTNCVDFSKFSWDLISHKYLDIYNSQV